MKVTFVKEINDMIADTIMEDSDDEILACIGEVGYPPWKIVNEARSMMLGLITENRVSRLKNIKASYRLDKENRSILKAAKLAAKGLDEMIADIAKAMQLKSDEIPNGLIVAFREQSKQGNEEDVRDIWENLVSLGLIDIQSD